MLPTPRQAARFGVDRICETWRIDFPGWTEMNNSWLRALLLLVLGFRRRYHMVAIFTSKSGTYGHLQIGGSPNISSLLTPEWYFQ